MEHLKKHKNRNTATTTTNSSKKTTINNCINNSNNTRDLTAVKGTQKMTKRRSAKARLTMRTSVVEVVVVALAAPLAFLLRLKKTVPMTMELPMMPRVVMTPKTTNNTTLQVSTSVGKTVVLLAVTVVVRFERLR